MVFARLGLLFTLLCVGISIAPGAIIGRALTYNHLGCFFDNVHGQRALAGAATTADDMTVAKCAAFCAKFELFGVEYGWECYFSDSRQTSSTKVDIGECSFACNGDSTGEERCGAGDQLNLYKNKNPTVRKPATLCGIKSLGCFVDNGARVFFGKVTSSSDITAAKCVADWDGFKMFGTQWSTECYCDTKTPSESAPSSDCNMPCGGNDDELCDAGFCLNVYKFDTKKTENNSHPIIVPSVPGMEYKGCYTDNIPQRVLQGKVVVDPAMTVEMCVATCGGGGYSYAAVEWETESYCGMFLDTESTKVSEGECSQPCKGNQSQK